MDYDKFMELYNASEEITGDPEDEDTLAQVLDSSGYHYYDVSGNGTVYVRSGTCNGVGYGDCVLTLQEDGLVVVRVASVKVPERHIKTVTRLCGAWNTTFKVLGLKVEGNVLVFETAPFDPVAGHFDADDVCDMALATIHHYASVVLALEAGVDPWDLIDLNGNDTSGVDDEDEDEDEDDDDADGMPLLGAGSLRDRLLRSLGDLSGSSL